MLWRAERIGVDAMKFAVVIMSLFALSACASRDSSGDLWQAVKMTQVNK